MSLLQLIYTPATAQINLVPNPSFEEYDSCPIAFGDFFVKNWNNPTISSPDYFNQCNTFYVSTPQNNIGFQYARTGNAYIGLAVVLNTSNFREYAQCKLLRPLKKDREYRFSFFISLADFFSMACDQIGVHFSDFPVSNPFSYNLDLIPSCSSKPGYIFKDKANWVEVEGTYKAIGGEEYLTIGFFAKDININTILLDTNNFGETIYYVDDVSVIEQDEFPLKVPTAFTPNGDNVNDLFYPVFFDHNLNVKEFRIYNQWGQVIHNNPAIPWDGTYKNEPQPQSVYTYYLYIDLPDPYNPNETITSQKVGSFSLIR